MITLQQEREFMENISPTLDEVIEWIKNNLNPEDVFDEDDLIEWAEDNGYFIDDEEFDDNSNYPESSSYT